MNYKTLNKLLFFGYLLLITALSLLPSKDMPDMKLFKHADKVIHCMMYAGFTFLLLNGWKTIFQNNNKWIIPIAIAIWGIGMELLQNTKGIGRSFDLWDEVANITGFFPGWFSVEVWWKLKSMNIK